MNTYRCGHPHSSPASAEKCKYLRQRAKLKSRRADERMERLGAVSKPIVYAAKRGLRVTSLGANIRLYWFAWGEIL